MTVFTTHSEQETVALGQKIGSLLKPGAIVLIYGDLGAGKTVLSRGIARGLGLRKLSKPYFYLNAPVPGRLEVYHLICTGWEIPKKYWIWVTMNCSTAAGVDS